MKCQAHNKKWENAQIFGNKIAQFYITHDSKKKSKGKLQSMWNWMKILKATWQYWWHATNAVVTGNFIALNIYVREEKNTLNHLPCTHLKKIEKEKEAQSKKKKGNNKD